MISLGHVIDEWMRVAEHEDSTRETYIGYIERAIKPALGSMSIAKLHADLVDRAGRINPLRAARHRPGLPIETSCTISAEGPGPPPSCSRVDPPVPVHEAARTTRKGRATGSE